MPWGGNIRNAWAGSRQCRRGYGRAGQALSPIEVSAVGAKELSPALQRWVALVRTQSAVGTAQNVLSEKICAVPTGLGFLLDALPALKRWAKLFRDYGALILLLALPAATQIQVGDNLNMNLNGVVGVGYNDVWGSDISSSHSVDFNGNG